MEDGVTLERIAQALERIANALENSCKKNGEKLQERSEAKRRAGKERAKKAARGPDGTFRASVAKRRTAKTAKPTVSNSSTTQHTPADVQQATSSDHGVQALVPRGADHLEAISSSTIQHNPARAGVLLDKECGSAVLSKESKKAANGRLAQQFLKTYCAVYKERYGVSPELIGKDIGIVQRLVASKPVARLQELAQAYLQMSDDWFMKRTHDIPTFEGSLGKIAVSLAQGTENPHEKRYWENVFGNGGGDAPGDVSDAAKGIGGGLRSEQLLSTGSPAPVASLLKLP